MNNHTFGKAGEDLAATLLAEKGYEILMRGYRCPEGEIDIVCEKDRVIHFVEVKTRSSCRFGLPEESVDRRKTIRIRKAAVRYINENRPVTDGYSFDVVSVVCEHLKGVF